MTDKIEEALTEHFGERCPDYEPGCPCCDAWAELDALTARADLPAAVTVKPLECENCRQPATKLCQMTTHDCDPMPICEQCAAQHDATAAEINEREMREFGGAYGMVTYHYLPLPEATQPDPVKDAARENRLAECLSDLCLAARRSRDLINTKVSDLDVITFTATKGQLKAALRALRPLAEQEQSK